MALYISGITAIYTILEKPKARTEPILRVTPTLSAPPFMGNLGLKVSIENIGYGIAKDIQVKCQLIPNGSTYLEDNGIGAYPLLAPKENPIEYLAIPYVENAKLLSQEKLVVEVSYMNEDNRKQKTSTIEKSIRELEQEFKRRKFER